MVEKKDGAEMTCNSCGTELICHMSKYKGDFKNKLQWQNEDGTAHYKFNGKDYSCNIPEGTDPEEIMLNPKEETITASTSQEFSTGGTAQGDFPFDNLTDHEMIARTYDMISQMFCDWCDKKLKESKTQ